MTTEPESAKVRADWNKPKPDVIPRSTYWPATMALALTLLLWGFVTSPVVLGFGLLMVALSLVGWVGEMRHER